MKKIIWLILLVFVLISCWENKNKCEISWKVIFPKGFEYNVNNLEVNIWYADTLLKKDLSFCFSKNDIDLGWKKVWDNFLSYKKMRKKRSDVTIFNNGKYILSSTIFPWESSINISSASTASTIISVVTEKSNIKEDQIFFNKILNSNFTNNFSKYLEKLLVKNWEIDSFNLINDEKYKEYLNNIINMN